VLLMRNHSDRVRLRGVMQGLLIAAGAPEALEAAKNGHPRHKQIPQWATEALEVLLTKQ
jgi:hypothetical protein